MRPVRKGTETLKTDTHRAAPSPCAESPAVKDPAPLFMSARGGGGRCLATTWLQMAATCDGLQKPPLFQTSSRPMSFDENLLKLCSSLPPSASPIDRLSSMIYTYPVPCCQYAAKTSHLLYRWFVFNLFYALGIHPCVLRAFTCGGRVSIPKVFPKMRCETQS